VGKGTVFVPAAHGSRGNLHDPERVEPFGPFRAEKFFDASLPWVSPTATHVAPLRGARLFAATVRKDHGPTKQVRATNWRRTT